MGRQSASDARRRAFHPAQVATYTYMCMQKTLYKSDTLGRVPTCLPTPASWAMRVEHARGGGRPAKVRNGPSNIMCVVVGGRPASRARPAACSSGWLLAGRGCCTLHAQVLAPARPPAACPPAAHEPFRAARPHPLRWSAALPLPHHRRVNTPPLSTTGCLSNVHERPSARRLPSSPTCGQGRE